MSIAVINGSPKTRCSNSGYIIREIKRHIGDQDIITFKFNKPELQNGDVKKIMECEVLIFVFPLYVDGIPSHLVNCLKQLETILKERQIQRRVYVAINCGFYEGRQNAIALDMMKNWCRKVNAVWGQGIGVGGGGMMRVYENIPGGKRIQRNYLCAIRQISDNIMAIRTGKDIYVSPDIPRIFYHLGVHMGWRIQIRRQGLMVKDLHTRK